MVDDVSNRRRDTVVPGRCWKSGILFSIGIVILTRMLEDRYLILWRKRISCAALVHEHTERHSSESWNPGSVRGTCPRTYGASFQRKLESRFCARHSSTNIRSVIPAKAGIQVLCAALVHRIPPETLNPVGPVRPEPVEGQEESVHPSTSSGRTDSGRTGSDLRLRRYVGQNRFGLDIYVLTPRKRLLQHHHLPDFDMIAGP